MRSIKADTGSYVQIKRSLGSESWISQTSSRQELRPSPPSETWAKGLVFRADRRAGEFDGIRDLFPCFLRKFLSREVCLSPKGCSYGCTIQWSRFGMSGFSRLWRAMRMLSQVSISPWDSPCLFLGSTSRICQLNRLWVDSDIHSVAGARWFQVKMQTLLSLLNTDERHRELALMSIALKSVKRSKFLLFSWSGRNVLIDSERDCKIANGRIESLDLL